MCFIDTFYCGYRGRNVSSCEDSEGEGNMPGSAVRSGGKQSFSYLDTAMAKEVEALAARIMLPDDSSDALEAGVIFY